MKHIRCIFSLHILDRSFLIHILSVWALTTEHLSLVRAMPQQRWNHPSELKLLLFPSALGCAGWDLQADFHWSRVWHQCCHSEFGFQHSWWELVTILVHNFKTPRIANPQQADNVVFCDNYVPCFDNLLFRSSSPMGTRSPLGPTTRPAGSSTSELIKSSAWYVWVTLYMHSYTYNQD